MSALNKMAAEVSASKMQPRFPPKPKSDSAKELPKESYFLGNGPIDSGRMSVDIPDKALKEFSDRRPLSKYPLPVSQHAIYTSDVANIADKGSTSSISRFLNDTPRRTKQEDILDYVYDWAAWAAEIPNPSRRSEVLQSVMKTLERALQSGMERTGTVLAPNDVEGTKNGTKKTLEGEVNIQVIITNNVKEESEKIVDKLAVRMVKENVVKDKKDDTGATVGVPSEPVPTLLMSVEEASKAPQKNGKRATDEMDPSEALQDIKRRKTETVDGRGEEKGNTTHAADGDDLDRQEKLPSESISAISQGEEGKQARYRQQIFQRRLNHILKKAGKVQTRGKCTNWETVLTRLKDAGVGVKCRNKMLRDFVSGHQSWNGDDNIDPNEELAHYAEHGFEEAVRKASAAHAHKVEAEAVKQAVEPSQSEMATTLLTQLETLPALNTEPAIPDAFVPAQALPCPAQPGEPATATATATTTTTTISTAITASTTSSALDRTQPKKLIATLRTLPGFDPEDFSAYGVYQHENFMFSYTAHSTVSERVMLSEQLILQVDRKLDAAIDGGSGGGGGGDDDDDDTVLDAKRQFIRNERGRVVATGNFVDLNSEYMRRNGLADAEQPWKFKGKQLKVDWAYYPSNWMERLKRAGEALAAKVEE